MHPPNHLPYATHGQLSNDDRKEETRRKANSGPPPSLARARETYTSTLKAHTTPAHKGGTGAGTRHARAHFAQRYYTGHEQKTPKHFQLDIIKI